MDAIIRRYEPSDEDAVVVPAIGPPLACDLGDAIKPDHATRGRRFAVATNGAADH
jgi:hypothetical protein